MRVVMADAWYLGWPHPDLRCLADMENFQIVEVCPGTVKSRRMRDFVEPTVLSSASADEVTGQGET